MKDIWFDLCVGEIGCNEQGTREMKKERSRLSILSPTIHQPIADHREELHRLLDEAIDRL